MLIKYLFLLFKYEIPQNYKYLNMKYHKNMNQNNFYINPKVIVVDSTVHLWNVEIMKIVVKL